MFLLHFWKFVFSDLIKFGDFVNFALPPLGHENLAEADDAGMIARISPSFTFRLVMGDSTAPNLPGLTGAQADTMNERCGTTPVYRGARVENDFFDFSHDFLTRFWKFREIHVAQLGSKSGFSWKSINFDRLCLRAQEELEARTTCVAKPKTWSLRRIKFCEKIFSKKKVTAQ